MDVLAFVCDVWHCVPDWWKAVFIAAVGSTVIFGVIIYLFP